LDESETGGSSAKESGPDRGLRGPTGRGGRVYELALSAALAIPVGFGLGYLVDAKFGTFPIALILGGALGFFAFVRQLLRLRSLFVDGGDGEGQQVDAAERAETRDGGGRSGS
jgi:hypothetical protein